MKTLNRLIASIKTRRQIATIEGQVQRLFNLEPLADSQREQVLFHRLARLGNQVEYLAARASLTRLDADLAKAVVACQAEMDRLEAAWGEPTYAREEHGQSLPGTDGTTRIVVAYRSAAESLGPLRWAIQQSELTNAQLVVVHQAPITIAVHNGPTAAIAHRMGNPTWATLFPITRGLGAPENTQTVVESAPEHVLVAQWCTPGTRIVVSAKSHAKRLQRLLNFEANIVQIPSDWIQPTAADTSAAGDESLGALVAH